MVGLNAFVGDEEMEIEVREPDPGFERKKVEDLKALKKSRDRELAQACLEEIREVAQGADNVMPVLIKAVRSYVTLGEIINVMKEVFGEFREEAIY